jgi:sigma54-dependent transcription regulator
VFFLGSDISTFIISRDNNLLTKEEIRLHESFQIKLDLTTSKKKVFFLKFQQQPKSILKYGIAGTNPYQQIQCHKVIIKSREIQKLLFPSKMEESNLKRSYYWLINFFFQFNIRIKN